MIEIRNIQKHFGSHHVLKGINLSVRKGEVVTIIGPSGSGKTTFLRCLNLLERPDEGAISLHGEVINCKSLPKDILRLRKQTAMVFQQYHLFSHKTAIQNVMEGLTVARKMKNQMRTPLPSGNWPRWGFRINCMPIRINCREDKSSGSGLPGRLPFILM